VAFDVARSGHIIDPASIDAHCRARMAAFKRTRQVVEVDGLPKTVTGKIRSFALRDRLAAGACASRSGPFRSALLGVGHGLLDEDRR
jgi:acyl-CoA synthetase (AMP-forming)/AMP-acid ligase II